MTTALLATPLDLAHAAMDLAPGDDAARLAFFGRLAECELFLLLETEPDGDDISPDLFDVDEGQFALVFDRQDRLAAFAERAAPMAAMPGRVLARMLAGHEIGIALNPGVAPSAILIPADGVAWLAEMIAVVPQTREGRPLRFMAPAGMPEGLFAALDQKLATAIGLASTAWLAMAEWEEGGKGLILAFVGAVPGAEPALAGAVSEAMAFSGLGSGWLDVLFLAEGDLAAVAVEGVGLGFVLARPVVTPSDAVGPGMDPGKPPRGCACGGGRCPHRLSAIPPGYFGHRDCGESLKVSRRPAARCDPPTRYCGQHDGGRCFIVFGITIFARTVSATMTTLKAHSKKCATVFGTKCAQKQQDNAVLLIRIKSKPL